MTTVEQYEEERYPLEPTTPLRMLKGFMESRDLKPRDLWAVLGSKAAVSHLLSGRREISKAQAKKMGAFFRVPVPGLPIDRPHPSRLMRRSSSPNRRSAQFVERGPHLQVVSAISYQPSAPDHESGR